MTPEDNQCVSDINDRAVEDNDFKYVLQDASGMYLGARFSYEEILEHEMIPFKFKTIITSYILKEASPETTLESQFYFMEQGSFIYETFFQLKTKVKVNIRIQKKSLIGKPKWVYNEKVLTMQELAEINLAKKKGCGLLIREIIVSKLGLLTFSI